MRTHIKENSKSALLALCEGNSPVSCEFSAQRASNAEKIFFWWRHHDMSPPPWQAKTAQKKENQQTVTKITFEGGQDNSACHIFSHGFSRKCQEISNLPCLLNQNGTKMRNISRPWQKSNHFWGWSGYICTPNFRPFFPRVLTKIAGNLKLISFTKSKWHQNEDKQRVLTPGHQS